jgi:hypothetical protein
MEEDTQVIEPQVDGEATSDTPEVVVDTNELLAQLEKEREARRQLTARAREAEAKAKAAEERARANTAPLAVEDYIDISAALDGLDAREKAYLAEQHKLSGRTLREIREGEDFQLWNSAYRAKLEKEIALKPSTTQAEEAGPLPLSERLRGATVAEKEQILRELNLYKESRPRADRTKIGNIGTR